MTTKTNRYIILHRANLGGPPCRGIESFSRVGIKAVQNDNIPESDVCIRWGTTTTLPNQPKVINRAKAIHSTSNKGAFRDTLGPLAPRTVRSIIKLAEKYEDGSMKGPWIVRPAYHQRSEGLYLCRTLADTIEKAQSLPDFYISEFIDKAAEYRVFVCQGRVVWAIEKVPKDKKDISWGCVSEGQFKYIAWSEWPIPVLENAVKVMANTTLDFGAVDVMLGVDGKAYCAEVNTAPFMTPYYQKRTANVFDWMIEGNKPEELKKMKEWKDFIHPVLLNEAN